MRKFWICEVCKKKTQHAICFDDKGKEHALCQSCYLDVCEGKVIL